MRLVSDIKNGGNFISRRLFADAANSPVYSLPSGGSARNQFIPTSHNLPPAYPVDGVQTHLEDEVYRDKKESTADALGGGASTVRPGSTRSEHLDIVFMRHTFMGPGV